MGLEGGLGGRGKVQSRSGGGWNEGQRRTGWRPAAKVETRTRA